MRERKAKHSGAGAAPSKHDVILSAATRVFLHHGYGLTSMDAIACEAGVSKQTIYSHFGGKASLFGAIIEKKCAQLVDHKLSGDTHGGAPEKILKDVAESFLGMMLDPENMANFRIVIAESGRFPELARAFYMSGPRSAVESLSTYLEAQDREGQLSIDDPIRSARLFFAMLRSDLYICRLLGIEPEPAVGEIRETVDLAVETFLAAHTPGNTYNP